MTRVLTDLIVVYDVQIKKGFVEFSYSHQKNKNKMKIKTMQTLCNIGLIYDKEIQWLTNTHDELANTNNKTTPFKKLEQFKITSITN